MKQVNENITLWALKRKGSDKFVLAARDIPWLFRIREEARHQQYPESEKVVRVEIKEISR